MKKILLIGIGEENSPKQYLPPAFKKNAMPFIYAKWSDLSFQGKDVFVGQIKLDFKNIKTVIFDIFRFPIIKKVSKQAFNYNLENEFNILLNILKEKGIYTPNHTFFLQYPFYNKFSQMHIFASKKIPTISTLHLCDNKKNKVLSLLKKQSIPFPLVAKESYGGGGNNVWKISNKKALESFIENRRNINTVFQPYIKNDADYRAIVINGECIGLMKRSAQKGQWKNNFSLGGKVQKYIDPKMSRFAVNVCKKMGLEMVGLDILATKNGFVIIEANLFFGLDGFQSVHPEINIAEKIIKLISTKNICKK
ncbi:MAG: ATP-grasp domain-containing protein [Candidatus Moranbacteria bacterium]|nr:ATP-grasp domain-containing protein [Candidatus Moranbacteria bacterium]